MNRLTAYLGKTMITFTAVAACLLLGIELLFSVVNEFRVLGTGDYNTLNMLVYLLLTAPQKIVKLFPLSVLLGTLIGLGSLASHSELIVMRTQGLSILNIIGILMKTGVVLVAFMWGIGEIAVPFLEQKANQLKAVAMSGGQALETKQGIWMRDGQSFVHVDNISLDGRLDGITRYEFDSNLHCTKISYALYGYYKDHHWMLYKVQESLLDENTPRISHATFESQQWNSVLSPKILKVVSAKSLEKLSLVGLWNTLKYRKTNHLETRVVELIFWGKVVQPLVTLVMILLAVPCVFGPLRNSTMGLRLLTGLSVGFSFYIVTQLFAHLSISDILPPILVVILPVALVFMVGLFSIYRIK